MRTEPRTPARRASRFGLLLTLTSAASLAQAPAPFTGQETHATIEFELPVYHSQGRIAVETNGFTVAWDGRLVMYQDMPVQSPVPVPGGATNYWYVFAPFDKSQVTTHPTTGNPDFAGCFGTPLYRFANVNTSTAPSNLPPPFANDYPTATGYQGGAYPFISNTMGELGLRAGFDSLSHNLHPVPDDELPWGADHHNPFRSLASGAPSPNGPCLTYHAYVTFQDQPTYWTGAAWTGYTGGSPSLQTNYWGSGTWANPGVFYPNGFGNPGTQTLMKRNGVAKLEIIVDTSIDPDAVIAVNVREKWRPFRVQYGAVATGVNVGLDVPSLTEMWLDTFEPTLTNDGHLMVGKGNRLVGGTWHAHVVFFYNTTAFGIGGWQGPWDLHHLYEHRHVVLDGQTIEERYPLSRERIKAYDGTLFGDTSPADGTVSPAERDAIGFEGGYTWLSPDGRYVIYSVYTGGVGSELPGGFRTGLTGAIPGWSAHPQSLLAQDGGGTSNRAHVSIVGSVTGWQQWRIDNPAVNPSRHLFTGWDRESRTTFLRTASFGFSPGFWSMLEGAEGLPRGRDGLMKLHLVNNNQRLFYEVDLSPYQERDYGFYLPMTELLVLVDNTAQNGPIEHRTLDLTRTPDLSGNGHFGLVVGAQLPCEYFELPAAINGPGNAFDKFVLGLHRPAVALDAAAGAAMIHPTWQATDVVQGAQRILNNVVHHEYWARLADWKDGVGGTSPFDGRGNRHDMDSDMCWGRVGQAMFFRDNAYVYVKNDGEAELNPGTTMGSDGLTASLWIHPQQARTGDVLVYRHNIGFLLAASGQVAALLLDAGGGLHILPSVGTAPIGQWTHVALTWKDTVATGQSEAILYLDGVQDGATLSIPSDRLLYLQQQIDIGCLGSVATVPGESVFLLDEVALKNSAMNATDVRHMALLPPLPDPTWVATNLPPAPAPFSNAEHARVPAGNPYDTNVAMLGADLFRDVQLSGQKQVSCATCHVPEQRFTDGEAVSIGQGGATLRNSPTVMNQRFHTRQFWDARAADLEAQALDPVLHSPEMANTWANLLAYISTDPDYAARFAAYFPGPSPYTEDNVRKALATFMRAPTTGNSAVDRGALSSEERNGQGLFFGKARCSGCHSGPDFTDGRLWNTGSVRADGVDDGASRAEAGPETAGRARYLGAFKTPMLRDLLHTDPYFHDGHAADLATVVAFYNAGGVRTDALGFQLTDDAHHFAAEEINRPLGLTPTEEAALVAFLEALSGDTVDLGPPGLNRAPSVYVLPPSDQTGSPTAVIIDVTDLDTTDIETTMAWTLEVKFTNAGTADWTSGSVSVIPGGHRIAIPTGVFSGTVRAADRHGKWSSLVAF